MRNPIFLLVGSVVAVIVLLAVFLAPGFYAEDTYRNCVVTGKDRTKSTDSNGTTVTDARIYTENCGVFQVGDSMVKGQFNSADTYGSINENKTYDFVAFGYRNGFLSMFPNIIEATEVK